VADLFAPADLNGFAALHQNFKACGKPLLAATDKVKEAMSVLGPSRHSVALRNLVAIRAWRH
jgi:hypothetical protein